MKFLFILMISSFLLKGTSLFAQGNFIERTYFGGSGEFLDTASNGNYLIGADPGYFLINEHCDTVKTFSHFSSIKSIRQITDNGFICLHNSGNTAVLSRTDSLDNIIWTENYPPTYNGTSGITLINHTGGNYLLTYLNNDAGPNDDYHLLVVDSNGQTLSDTIANNAANSSANAYSICKTGDGGYMHLINGWSEWYFNLYKIDSTGNVSWNKWFADTSGIYSSFHASTITRTSGGDYLIGAGAWYMNGVFSFPMLIKVDSMGNELWRKSYDSIYTLLEPVSVLEDPNGDLFLSVTSVRPGGFTKVLLMETDSAGNTLWTRYFNGKGSAEAASMIFDRSNNPMIVGSTFDTLAPQNFIYLIKVDTTGVLLNVPVENNNSFQLYPNPATDEVIVEIMGENNSECKFTLFDSMGLEVLHGKFTMDCRVDLSGRSNGFYNLKIDRGERSYYKRILVSH
jgi:hypothetical protein